VLIFGVILFGLLRIKPRDLLIKLVAQIKFFLIIKYWIWTIHIVIIHRKIVEDVANRSTNKLSTFVDFFNFYFTTCFNPKYGPLQVSLHFELTLTITQQNN
jgi:hypothetical protein